MRWDNDLLRAARPQRLIDRLIDRLMIAGSLIALGWLIGMAMFGNK